MDRRLFAGSVISYKEGTQEQDSRSSLLQTDLDEKGFQMGSRDPIGEQSRLPLWKAVTSGTVMFGPLSAVLTYAPEYSLVAMVFAATFFVAGIIAIAWASSRGSWWGRIVGIFILSVEFLAVGLRAWASVIEGALIWFLPVLVVFFTVWFLPWMRPELSKYLWMEQTVPESRAGRIIVGAALSILPVSGALGASIGLFGSRNGDNQMIMIFAGLLMSVGGLSLAQAGAHQLWPERPWASYNGGS